MNLFLEFMIVVNVGCMNLDELFFYFVVVVFVVFKLVVLILLYVSCLNLDDN